MDTWMERRTDRQRENSIPAHKHRLQGGGGIKTISLKYDFKHTLNDFIHVHVHVYSPRAGTDNPLGTKDVLQFSRFCAHDGSGRNFYGS